MAMTCILDSHAASESVAAGNKARRLAQLHGAGFNVPPFFVLTPDGLTRDTGNVAYEVAIAVRRLSAGGTPLAVRSSSVEEDSAEHSFAGQLASFLNVPSNEVYQRAREVVASATTEHALAYRKQQGLPGDPAVPAVLVQVMVDAVVAGVAFAMDPVTGNRDVAVVSAGMGLGDQLVNGETDGCSWHISARNKIIRRNPVAGRGTSFLSDRQVRKIAKLVRKVSRYFGRPQDIEWALHGKKLYLLQSRDITGSAVSASGTEYALWDNSNIVESYGGVTTPLTFSVAQLAYCDAYRHLGRAMGVSRRDIERNSDAYEQMIGLIDGRVYYNLLNWYRLLMLAPGFRLNSKFMEQMMGVTAGLPPEALPSIDGRGFADRLRASFGLLRVTVSLSAKLLAHAARVQIFHRRIEAALLPVDLPRQSLSELVAYYQKLQRTVLPAWDTPLLNDLYCMIFHGALSKLCERWLPSELAHLHNDLVAGENGMISLEPLRCMQEMADVVRVDREFVSMLCNAPLAVLETEITRHSAFYRQYTGYLERFGDRCLDELKLESPTVGDDPQSLLRTVGHLAQSSAAGVRCNGELLRRHAEQRLENALRRQPWRRFLLSNVLRIARARVRDRENMRFERTRVYGRVRAVFVEAGKKMQQLGVLRRWDDVFYLEQSEVVRFATGTGSSGQLSGLAELRRREFTSYRNDEDPPRRFITRGPAQLQQSRQMAESPSADLCGNGRRGQACSPGVVQGPVRIVRDPRTVQISAGDILVAERTDPGWVTIFPLAAGIVMERGSLLSHSAIVARELGLPAVVGIADACSWLHDGEWVELNGTDGTVRRLCSEASAA